MYAKINNNRLEYAPHYLNINDKQILNPTGEDYLKAGYKEVEFGQKPQLEPDKKLTESYMEYGTKILVSYTHEDIQKPYISREDEIKQQLYNLDLISIRPLRAGEVERIKELDTQAQALREELNGINQS